MNLIEQLGGYWKAKEELKIRISKGFVYSVIELEEALLEYRHQHNIFEVGDKVVDTTEQCNGHVLTVKSISDSIMVCESDDHNASYVLSNKYKPSFYVRHATDTEIKSGKRLEILNESD